ncbi:MAG: DNA alkylation repair protein [Chitinophagales bacterium]|nr:DNA alkylation repair protein [Chitinophagales bacterium]
MTEESTAFKDVFFKPAFIHEFADALSESMPGFDKKAFERKVFDKDWHGKELKQRTRHIVLVLHQLLPKHFPDAVQVIERTVSHLQTQKIKSVSFGYISLPEYIEVYGLGHYKESVRAMEKVTVFMSCEFAVRPFIVKYGDRMMKQMLAWSKHKDARVRRLSSEGCRPRLPWAMALPEFKKDPSPILPILENLKEDSDVWVKKTVANNLNDISKDHPELAISIFEKWLRKNKHTDWIVKHAARTLLKAGNPEVMALFGFKKDKQVVVKDITVETPKVKMGKELVFSFAVTNKSKEPKLIRLEYGMHYLRANGTHSKKVFKISEREYQPGAEQVVTRKQSFKPITTRVYYPGLHKVSVIVNGHEAGVVEFVLQQ